MKEYGKGDPNAAARLQNAKGWPAMVYSLLKMNLSGARQRIYAEFETDRFIRENVFSDFDYQGAFVEVGGATPEFLSMSKHFKDTGWRWIVIEPNPELLKLQKAAGNEVVESAPFRVVNWANIPASQADQISEHSFSSLEVKQEYLDKHGFRSIEDLSYRTIQAKVRTLNSILEEMSLARIDILSVDTEGWESEVMEGFDLERYRPEIVILEDYLAKKEYDDFMADKKYPLFRRCGHNSVFRRRIA